MQSAKPEIRSRKIDFDLSADIPRHWNNGDPVKTHFLNAFSVILPAFEQFFIVTIAKNKTRVTDPVLKKDIVGFCAQEGAHATEHRKYNQLLESQGYKGIRVFEKLQSQILRFFQKNLSNDLLIAMTAAGEHVTAFMGDDFVNHPEKWSKNSHPTMNALWQWHAIEEIEHKAVCFDTYKHVCGKEYLRVLALLLINVPTLAAATAIQFYLLAKDGLIFKAQTWIKYFHLMYGRGGFMRGLVREYIRYFKKDFHPWQNENQLI